MNRAEEEEKHYRELLMQTVTTRFGYDDNKDNFFSSLGELIGSLTTRMYYNKELYLKIFSEEMQPGKNNLETRFHLWRIYKIICGIPNRLWDGEAKDEYAIKEFHYSYIPSGVGLFIPHIEYLRKKYPRFENFLDVGHGIGEKPFLASFCGFNKKNCFGIEYTQETYWLSRFLSTWYDFPEKNLQLGNAFDLSDFYDNKLVYLYMPIQHMEGVHKLYDHILSNMKNGILFEIYDWPIEEYLRTKKIRQIGGLKPYFLVKDGVQSVKYFPRSLEKEFYYG